MKYDGIVSFVFDEYVQEIEICDHLNMLNPGLICDQLFPSRTNGLFCTKIIVFYACPDPWINAGLIFIYSFQTT